MCATQDQPGTAGSAQAQPHTPWPGPDASAAPPGYEAAGNPGRQPRRPHGRLLAITAAAALAAGAGSAWLATAGGAADTVLTMSQIVTKTNPGIVDVVSTLGYQQATASGTGIVLTSSGLVLTNNHVIDGASSVKVREVSNGRVYQATVVGYDAAHDIAVLQLKGASGLPTATLGDSSEVSIGQKVVALGNALGKDSTPSVATGRITGLNQSITASDDSASTAEHLQGLIRTNAGIQPGDSGGPLVNTRGQIIGIDTAASAGSGSQLSSSTVTQAFTIPINEAVAIARQIEAGQSSATTHIGSTAFLGIAIAGSSGGTQGIPASTGAEVAGAEQGSAAASAGLTAGDTITSLGGQSITSPAGIRSVLVGHHPGDSINVTWTDQAGDGHSATVVLTAGPAG